MLSIDYAEGLNLAGKTSIGSIENIDCTLLIANSSFPHVDIGNAYYNQELREYFKSPPSAITFTSQHNVFTLYNNESSGSSFIPEFIISGREPENINGVAISLNGLYSFFDGRSNFEVKDSCISKNITDRFVETQFYMGGVLYYFSVEHDYSYTKKITTTTLIEDAIVRVRRARGNISFDEIKNIVKKIRILFSLLLGFDLSIKKTWIVSDDVKHITPLYFYAPSKSSQPFEQPHECLIYSAQLLNNDDWAKILTSAFNNVNPSISDFWVRLVSMFSYKGFWEYEILGVVSLLDAYSKNYHKIYTDKKMPAGQFKKIKNQMRGVLRDYKSELPENNKKNTICEVVDNIELQLSYIKNTNAQDFKVILDILMETIKSDIKNLINFKGVDFEIIIKIRNLAAHGSPINDSIIENLQQVMITKEKIKFLLLYIFFGSLGFSDVDFIKLCRNSFNKIKLGANLDPFTLKITYGNDIAFDVDAENIVKAKTKSRINAAIIFHVKSNRYEINNKALNEVIESIFTTNRGNYFNVIDLIYSEFINDEIFSVEYFPSVFLCCGNEKVELHGAYLIKSND